MILLYVLCLVLVVVLLSIVYLIREIRRDLSGYSHVLEQARRK